MPELTATTSTRRQYKDLSLTFARNPVTSDVVAVSDSDAVKRSIKMLLLTRTGEAPFFPNFGSRIQRLLFEPADAITTVLLENEIRDTLSAFEPRAALNQISAVLTNDELGYDINIEFSIITQSQPITLTLYLSRLR